MPDLHAGTSGQPNFENSLKFLDFVHKNVNPNKKMLTLSGGEPTMWPRLGEFLRQMNPNYYVTIVTNGSRTLRWWQDFIEEVQNLTVVTISVHLEYADLEHIISVCKILDKKIRTTVLVLFNPAKKEEAYKFAERLAADDLNVTYTIKPITTRFEEDSINESLDYSIEDKEFIAKHTVYRQKGFTSIPTAATMFVDGERKPSFFAGKMIADKTNKFAGWWCEAGRKRLTIWHDGNVYGAQCLTAKRNLLGNINDGEIKIINGLVCDIVHCACLPDLRIPKRKVYNLEKELSGESDSIIALNAVGSLNTMPLRQLQLEAARVVNSMDATNDNIHKFNIESRHNSQNWYKSALIWYINKYGNLPSIIGPGKEIKFIYEQNE
jgi:MoaA/NifB/PqqE/SkfB family radical SAM enzyme